MISKKLWIATGALSAVGIAVGVGAATADTTDRPVDSVEVPTPAPDAPGRPLITDDVPVDAATPAQPAEPATPAPTEA